MIETTFFYSQLFQNNGNVVFRYTTPNYQPILSGFLSPFELSLRRWLITTSLQIQWTVFIQHLIWSLSSLLCSYHAETFLSLWNIIISSSILLILFLSPLLNSPSSWSSLECFPHLLLSFPMVNSSILISAPNFKIPRLTFPISCELQIHITQLTT